MEGTVCHKAQTIVCCVLSGISFVALHALLQPRSYAPSKATSNPLCAAPFAALIFAC